MGDTPEAGWWGTGKKRPSSTASRLRGVTAREKSRKVLQIDHEKDRSYFR